MLTDGEFEIDGLLDGTRLGCLLGLLLGFLVGVREGLLLGSRVGDWLEILEGVLLGEALGPIEILGRLDGRRLGCLDGALLDVGDATNMRHSCCC